MKLIEDSQEFVSNLSVWSSKNRTMDGINVLAMRSDRGVEYEAVVYDYIAGEVGYIHDIGPFESMQDAFGFIGAVLDEIEEESRRHEVRV